MFAPPFGPSDFMGSASSLDDNALIGGTEGMRETGQRGFDEPGFDRRRENASHRRPQLLWTPHLAVIRRDVVRKNG